MLKHHEDSSFTIINYCWLQFIDHHQKPSWRLRSNTTTYCVTIMTINGRYHQWHCWPFQLYIMDVMSWVVDRLTIVTIMSVFVSNAIFILTITNPWHTNQKRASPAWHRQDITKFAELRLVCSHARTSQLINISSKQASFVANYYYTHHLTMIDHQSTRP